MADREFPKVKTFAGGGQTLAFEVKCSGCSKRDLFASHGRPPKAAEQHWRRKGWAIGASARADKCPECLARIAHPVKPELKVVSTKPKADPPREMSREDKRVIYAKLEEVYAGEHQGYSGLWTDEAVARDLGVPRGWVAAIRDEMFGPVRSNAEIDAMLVECRELFKAGGEFDRRAEEVIKTAHDLLKRLKDLESRATKIEKAVA